MTRKTHWEHVYQEKLPTTVSWYQENPTLSLSLITASGISKEQAIIDVGGGASLLVDHLLNEGFKHIAVLDIASTALQRAQQRLADKAHLVTWYEADITTFVAPRPFALWHDRAVFHFLTEAADRQRYVNVLKKTLMPDGHLIIAAFSLVGPKKCSGLDIVQYDAHKLGAELGHEFKLLETHEETHITPANSKQNFIYCRFQRQMLS